MKKAVIYVHGMRGNAEEAAHYQTLFPGYDVIGFDYQAANPWEALEEFPTFAAPICAQYDEVLLVAVSSGAYYAMYALTELPIARAFLISPVVDMERMLLDIMRATDVTEEALREQGRIGILSWEYMTYVRAHPLRWHKPTHMLYGENDNWINFDTVAAFASRIGAELTVMPGGEHWFHTPEQMAFLDAWLQNTLEKNA